MGKSERFGLALSTSDKRALARLAQDAQTSGAAVLRDLVRREVDRRAASRLTPDELAAAGRLGLRPSEYARGGQR